MAGVGEELDAGIVVCRDGASGVRVYGGSKIGMYPFVAMALRQQAADRVQRQPDVGPRELLPSWGAIQHLATKPSADSMSLTPDPFAEPSDFLRQTEKVEDALRPFLNFEREFKAMRALTGPPTFVRELQRANDAVRVISDSLAAARAVATRFEPPQLPSLTERYLETLKAIPAMNASLRESLVANAEVFERIAAPSMAVAEMLARLSGGGAIAKATEQIERWKLPVTGVALTLAKLQRPAGLEALTKVYEEVGRIAKLQEALQTAARLDANEPPPPQVAEAVQALEEAASSGSKQQSLLDGLSAIARAIEQTKDPVSRTIQLQVMLPILIAIFTIFLNPFADFFLKRQLEEAFPAPRTAKEVKAAVRAVVSDRPVRDAYRFIAAKQLAVRQSAKARSQTIATLHFGQLVRVIERRDDFTLVAWTAEDDAVEVRGWVFTRYVKRLD